MLPLRFLREFVGSTHTVGAIWPSSPFLADLIVEVADVDRARSIVELGPGEGSFTGHILKSKRTDAAFLALEKNEAFARFLKSRYPHARVVEGCATQLGRHADEHAMDEVDRVVSGLPWAIFPGELQQQILLQIHATLRPGGVFTTFAYYGPHLLPAGRAFRNRLESLFSSVETSRVEVRNFPPAFVYRALRGT